MGARGAARPRRPIRWLGVIAALALVAVGCSSAKKATGTTAATTAGSAGATKNTTAPVAGGSATFGLFSEIGTLDPVSSTGSAGSDGLRMYALYGALITYESAKDQVIPLLAQSFKPNGTDFTSWTLVLRPNLKFSDGSPFDAAAVKAEWDRVNVPANRSPGILVTRGFKATTVVDPVTLKIDLQAPNAYFDKLVERTGSVNYIPSAKAVTDGVDLKTKPVGAGPFILKSWLKDDTTTLSKNPNWYDAPRPYLDELVFKILTDETQRVNTFTQGDLQAFYTQLDDSVVAAQKAVKNATRYKVAVNTGVTYVFNNTKPPFDDARMRKAFVEGIDRVAMDHDVLGPASVPSTTWASQGTKFYDPKAVIAPYNPRDAQALIDSYVKDKGGPVKITFQAFQQTNDQDRAKFIQTQLNTYKNIQVSVSVGDSASNITRVIQKDYMVSSWGFPYLDPEPGLYSALNSKGSGNYSGYKNATVDAALDAARATTDVAERTKQYAIATEQAAQDLPYFPYAENNPGFVVSSKLQGVELYEDGIVRFDLVSVVK